ncbi:Satratoxin biosynthesis SC1 cluster protein [Lachnellula occidentalis]|uniref:Satratoxin biosynthesis SC1 cluster protein n=1 Tax=Lachnellula occidentalis TaxID=215460 RepID=A0A8H8RM68_9HELO|nr:Satratoxin biosynthesis SC1 cluster protein [Lachnellula occidentalis]
MGNASAQGRATTTASAVVAVLAVVVVILRFVTRKINKAGIGADDWWILVGLFFTILTGGLLLYGVRSDPDGGEFINRDSPTFDYAPHVTYLKLSFTTAVLYFTVVTSIKISILLMYRRVFSVEKFRLQSFVVGGVVVFWWFIGTLLAIVSCLPINRFWVGSSAGGYCFDFNVFWMGMGATELVIDTVILVLPMGIVWKLWMPLQQKILVAGIFLLGGFVIVTGLLRVVLGYKPGSQNVAFPKAELWSAVHIGIAIVCACLPTLRPLLNRATASVSALSHRMKGTRSSTNGASGDYTGSSNAGSNNRGKAEDLALKNVSSANSPTDPHADTLRLTREGGELRAFNHSESRFGLSNPGDNV